MKLTNAEKAEVLTQALPYIQKYNNQILAVKYGGSAMVDEDLRKSVMGDIVLLAQIGIKVVLIHGGGPEINETLSKMNIRTKFVNGLRQTDKEAVEVVQMVLSGKVNKSLVGLIQKFGGNAIGLSGVDGNMIEAEKISEELGFVGDIKKINTKPVLDILEKGYIPVISSIGCDKDGNIYNINADTAAAHIAGALNAYGLISLTDTKGILKEKDDESTLIKEINIKDGDSLIESGVISGGMIPKVKCCIDAVKKGVKKVFIIDGRVPHAILIEVLSDEGIGTMFFS